MLNCKATFFGNRAACHQAMGETALVVEDCTDSLECKPGYVKVLNRRCQAYETLKQYDEAVEGLALDVGLSLATLKRFIRIPFRCEKNSRVGPQLS